MTENEVNDDIIITQLSRLKLTNKPLMYQGKSAIHS